ncbi:MAG: hypothetical protein JW795_23210 [Chitinivibrionales bacterium]|nr:hypothetical protein [Chitinivibrionales bacterium]
MIGERRSNSSGIRMAAVRITVLAGFLILAQESPYRYTPDQARRSSPVTRPLWHPLVQHDSTFFALVSEGKLIRCLEI